MRAERRIAHGASTWQLSVSDLLWLVAAAALFIALVRSMGYFGGHVFAVVLLAAGSGLGIWPVRRRLLVASIVFFPLWALVLPLIVVAVWDGRTEVVLTVVPVDAETGEPVANASVKLVPDSFIREDWSAVELSGNPRGEFSATVACWAWGREGWLENARSIRVPQGWVEVEAAGYQPMRKFLPELAGTGAWSGSEVVPPVLVPLERAQEMAPQFQPAANAR